MTYMSYNNSNADNPDVESDEFVENDCEESWNMERKLRGE